MAALGLQRVGTMEGYRAPVVGLLGEWLARANAARVHLAVCTAYYHTFCVDSDSESKEDNCRKRAENVFSTVVDTITRHSSHIAHLEFYIPSTLFAVMSESEFSGTWEILSTLVLSMPSNEGGEEVPFDTVKLFQNSPALTDLTIDYCDSLMDYALPWSNLVNLKLKGIRCINVADALALCPRLETLTAKAVFEGPPWPPEARARRVVHKNLKSFRYTKHDEDATKIHKSQELFLQLQLPGLKSWFLRMGSAEDEEMPATSLLLRPLVSDELDATPSKLYIGYTGLDSQDMLAFLQFRPSLRHLRLVNNQWSGGDVYFMKELFRRMAGPNQPLLPNLQSLVLNELLYRSSWDSDTDDEEYISLQPLFDCLAKRWGRPGNGIDSAQAQLRSVVVRPRKRYPITEEQKGMLDFWRVLGYKILI